MSLIEISHLNDMERPLLFVNHKLLQIRHLRRRAIAHGHLGRVLQAQMDEERPAKWRAVVQ